MSDPVQTECVAFPVLVTGAPLLDVGVQLSVTGVYRAPDVRAVMPSEPPQMTMTLPVQTLVCSERAVGAPVAPVGVHVSRAGEYRPPVPIWVPLYPPHTIMSPPVQTAVWILRAVGTLSPVEVGDQASVAGL